MLHVRTHDLLQGAIETLGGDVTRILISGLEKNTYFASIVIDMDGDTTEVDSRPSDAIALAVRVSSPIFVADEVMDQAGLHPEDEVSLAEGAEGGDGERPSQDDLGAFEFFVDGLDLDNLLGN